MGINMDCADSSSPQDLTNKILDVLGAAYQTAGYIASILGNSSMDAMTPAAISLASSQSSIANSIAHPLTQSANLSLDARRTIAMLASSQFGQTNAQASKTARDCEGCCGQISNGIWTPISQSSSVPFIGIQSGQTIDTPAKDIVTLPLSGGQSSSGQADTYKTGFTTSGGPENLTVNVYTPPAKVITSQPCPPCDKSQTIKIIVPQNPTPGVDWSKYCNPDTGEGQILQSNWGPPTDPGSWTLLAKHPDVNSPWPDCPVPKKPDVSPELPSKPPQSFIVPESCAIDFYTGTIKGTVANDAAIVSNFLGNIFTSKSPIEWFGAIVQKIFGAAIQFGSSYACDSSGGTELQLLKSAYQQIEKLTGVKSEQILRRLDYDLNRTCPTILPTGDSAIANYLSGAIKTPQEMLKYTAIGGWCPETALQHLQTRRSKFIPDEIFALERRGECTGESANERLRQLGYIDPPQWDCLRKLQEFIPGPQDIVRFMVRDTGDDSVVNYFNLDTRFDDKYKGNVAKWGKWQGIPDDTMKHFWRSHWQIPGQQSLEEMYQRNRRKQFGDKSLVTLEDVKQGWLHLDILPFWQDKLESLLYRPISQRYIYEVYHYGGVNNDELFEHLCYVGYSDDDARVVTNGFERRKKDSIYQLRPVHLYQQTLINRDECKQQLKEFKYDDDFIDMSLDNLDLHFANHRDIKLYKEGIISYDECKTRLSNFGIKPESIEILLEGTIPSLQFSIAFRQLKGLELSRDDALKDLMHEGVNENIAKKMINAVAADISRDLSLKCRDNVKHDFMTGALDDQGARNKLIGFSIALDWANQLISSWQCELKSQGKTIPTNTLCDWFSKGTITPQEFQERLVNIGYKKEDATRLISDCIDRNNTKTQRQLEKQAAQLRSQLAAEQKERAKEARQTASGLSNLEKARARAKAADDKRQNALMRAASTLAKKGGLEPDVAASTVYSLFLQIKQDFGISTDLALEAIQRALPNVTTENATRLADFVYPFLSASESPEVTSDGI